MKKSKSTGGRKALIILAVLVFAAVLAVGVIRSVRTKQADTAVARAPAAQRMKVPAMPEAQQMKIPPAPPQVEPAQPPVEPAQAKSTADPVTPEVMPDASPPREEMEPAAIPASRLWKEVRDGAEADKTPPSDATAVETPAPEMSEAVQPVQALSSSPPLATPSQETPRPAAVTATITERFNLQVGAYRVEAYAREAVAKLSKKGYAPFILEITDARQRPWYTVRIGRYESYETAAASLESFKRNESIAAVIARTGEL